MTDKYCVYTNNFTFVDNDGYVALCCKNLKNKLSQYHIKDYKLSEIWNSPEMHSVRAEIASGGEPNGCFKCYDPERDGVRSFRQKALGMINNGVPFPDEKIHALDLRLGNVCNLSCVMCFAGNSNKILHQHKSMAKHFNWKEGRLEKEAEKYHKSNYDWSDDPVAWDNIISSVDKNLKHVYLAGGEPFYLKNFPTTVERLGSLAPGANFVINTNGTRLLREKDLKQLKTVENVFLRFSVDGWGAADEWTRQDTVWEQKLQVMDQYYNHFKLAVWDITANSLSVRHIPKLVEHLWENYPNAKVQIRPVVNKTEVLMENIPDRFKAESLAFFEKHKNKLEGVDHVINEMRKPFNNDMKRKQKVKHFVNYYDTHGVVTFDSFDPELAEWINSDAEE
jgi:MoaA/NifB/PqqE/SkfB family radical SAM enzyme